MVMSPLALHLLLNMLVPGKGLIRIPSIKYESCINAY